MSLTEWTNTPNLQWVNTIQEWLNIEILVTFFAAATFIAESRGYFFEALEKANFFLADEKHYFIEANNKP